MVIETLHGIRLLFYLLSYVLIWLTNQERVLEQKAAGIPSLRTVRHIQHESYNANLDTSMLVLL